MATPRSTHIWVTVLIVLGLTQTGTEAQMSPSAPQVRMRWQDFISGPEGTTRLASLQKGIQKMKSLDASPKNSADYRRSWQYWANIHGYYGSQSPDGTVADQIQFLTQNGMAQYVPYYQGITDQTPPDQIAKTVWATCQHSGQTQQAVNFFGWHRMYLYYYERVLRWAANDNTLRLPYWDYTDPTQVALPMEFRNTTAPIYDTKRSPDLNTGASTLSPDSTNVNDLLPTPNYFTYESRIEEGVHGYVHCTVGPTCPVAHMGDVPVAGNDPVFYSHHANIDRLWACWQELHGTPAGSWQNQKFSFVDETGKRRTKPVKNFINSAALGYVYDNVATCARVAQKDSTTSAAPARLGTASRGERKTAMVSASKSVLIKNPTTSIDLDVPRPQLEAVLADLQTPGATELVLRDITADSPPGVLFDVFLTKKDDPASRQHVGTISWFGAFRHRHGSKGGPEKKTLTFDVTDELRALGGAAAASGLTVVIEATQGRVSTDPAKLQAQREEASKTFRAEANLQIGAIQLWAVPSPGPNQ